MISRWILAAGMMAVLAGCQTAPKPTLAETKPAVSVPNEVPYHWTVGNAPQAHKDLVAGFGKVGLKPGEYVWAASLPSEGEPRIVADLLTQMVYLYKGDRLIGASSMSSAKTGHITPYGYWTI